MTKARTSGDRPPSTEERYLSSQNSSNLRVSARRVGGADAVIAAGMVAGGDERKSLALSVYQVLASTDMRGAKQVADAMGRKIVRAGERKKLPGITRIEAIDLSMLLLKTWHKRTCPECSGRGHPLMEGAPVQDLSVDCMQCSGTGQIPLERIFKTHQVPHARWLEAQINTMNSFVFTEMAKKLNTQMDL